MFKNVNFKKYSDMTKMIFIEIDEGSEIKRSKYNFSKSFFEK